MAASGTEGEGSLKSIGVATASPLSEVVPQASHLRVRGFAYVPSGRGKSCRRGLDSIQRKRFHLKRRCYLVHLCFYANDDDETKSDKGNCLHNSCQQSEFTACNTLLCTLYVKNKTKLQQ